MPYFTYILKSKISDRYYIGASDNLERRLALHNEGNSISTKAYIPWELVYYEKFNTKSEALKREKQLKKMKSKKYIEWLILNNPGGRPD
jgi:putative endonuclease